MCQPTFEPFQVADTLGNLAAAAIPTALVTSKHTQSLQKYKFNLTLY